MSETNGGVVQTNGNRKMSREEKLREAKIEEQITKGLSNLSTDNEKIQFLLKRCVEGEKQNKKFVLTQKQIDKSMEMLKKEKEQLQQEYNKVVLTKAKLESLCRELQKQNKTIKDESFSRIREEEEKRKETQAKFQKSLNEIQTLMNENNEKNMKLKADNQEMTNKFKFILEQYELREQQMEKINKQMELVQQLSDAKIAKCEMEALAEREQLLAEKAAVEQELLKNKQEVIQLYQTEKLLSEKVNIYSSKYSEFQDSLKRSHDVFVGYKTDMEKMSKKILKLEKDTASWRSKAEKANSIAIDLASEKQIRDEHIAKVQKQLWQLQKLCRTLQAERTLLISTLKEKEIEIPPMPEVPPEKEPEMPAEEPPSYDKLDIMTKNCAELKKGLAALQGQLNSIEMKGSDATPETNGNNKKNKQKNKKNKNNNKNAQEVPKTSIPETVVEPETEDTTKMEEEMVSNGVDDTDIVPTEISTPEVVATEIPATEIDVKEIPALEVDATEIPILEIPTEEPLVETVTEVKVTQ